MSRISSAPVYATPAYIETLPTSTPISNHVLVDFELRGCPINKNQLVELISAWSWAASRGCRATVSAWSASGAPRFAWRWRGIACLGPVTQAGCGAICPAFGRECFGCYGPKELPNMTSMTAWYEKHGTDRGDLLRLTRNFNGFAPEFREASESLEGGQQQAASSK